MIHDMEDMLSFEIKKEIADRYFGFRKMIEDDSVQYNQHIQHAYRQLENEVGFDLIRLYILLGRESLIHDFFRLTGLRDQVFLDDHADPLRRADDGPHQVGRGQRHHDLRAPAHQIAEAITDQDGGDVMQAAQVAGGGRQLVGDLGDRHAAPHGGRGVADGLRS